MIEKHEIRCKREAGLDGRRRGEEAAALESAGAVFGAFGMLAFAVTFSLTVADSIPAAFISASLSWAVVAIAGWCVRRKMRTVRRSRALLLSLGPAAPEEDAPR